VKIHCSIVSCSSVALGLALPTVTGLLFMLLLASAQAEAVPASKNKFIVHHQREGTIVNSQSFTDSIKLKLCKFFDDKVVLKRMKHRSFTRINSNINESSKVKNSKNLHERQVRSIEYTSSNDINTFARYDKTETRRKLSLESVVNNGESVSLENISQATLATSDVKSNAQKDSSDKIYLHVNGETMSIFLLPFLLL
jgi:hypothetical protein